jgi:hypothetical protein
MEDQNYKNHIRFYPAHHFVFYPFALMLLGTSIYFAFCNEQERTIYVFISILILLAIWLSFMLRQHYALILQNRIIRLELRYRYFTLTNERLELIEEKLSDGQLFALRFASDEEFPELVKRAILENLTPVNIKKSIKNWKADHNRV